MSTLEIFIASEGVGVPDVPVTVKVINAGLGLLGYGGCSDGTGRAVVEFDDGFVEEVDIEPRAHWWNQVVHNLGSFDRRRLEVELVRLPPLHREMWWHEASGTGQLENAGSGISIGVIDTGCADHPDLAGVVRRGSFLRGKHNTDPSSTNDHNGHGTHVVGIIASKPIWEGVRGMARDASVTSVRVFPDVPHPRANQMDIAEALDYLVDECACELINLSLGDDRLSEVLNEAIDDAAEKGTLCIAAAGNSGRVEYPAKLPDVFAIGALGKVGWAPASSVSANRLSVQSTDEGYAIARFSPEDKDLDAIAPGVGIISTVPDDTDGPVYGVMDGTSMAAPTAVAALACRLAQSSEYQHLPRTKERHEYLSEAFAACCRDLGFPRSRQGRGLVVATTEPADG